ncbi:MAG: hypothetical protein L0Z62_39145 [Gemmataceae bacterium]|nr:hypothetical protein [Gemmataceae bacterium]
MLDEDLTLDEARQRLIELIEADEWEITDSAVADGFARLRATGDYPTQWKLVKFTLQLLKDGFPIHAVPLGEPPGSLGVGYVMNNADGRGLYIKLKIEEDRVAQLLSFHTSKHSRG